MHSGGHSGEQWCVRGGAHTRISSAKLLSSPSRALTASKSNTNCARQQASVLLGQMRIPWAGKGGSTCGSVASALSSGAFSVVRTRPAGKTNKVAADRRARVRAERRTWRAHLARRRDEIPRRCCYRGRYLHAPDPWSSDDGWQRADVFHEAWVGICHNPQCQNNTQTTQGNGRHLRRATSNIKYARRGGFARADFDRRPVVACTKL